MFKKFLAVSLSLAMAFSLAGCTSQTKTESGEIKLADYKGLVVYHDDVEVTDEAYQAQVESLLTQDSTTELVKKGKVKADSTVNVDYEGKIEADGKKVAFDGGSAQGQDINMATDGANYIEGFVSCLKGKKVGTEFTKKLKFPKSYTGTTTINKKDVKLAGKTVWFTFKVNGLQNTKKPELTDEYVAKKFGAVGVKTVKEFEKYAKKQMRMSNIMNKVWQKFVDKCEVVSYDKKEKESLKKEQESQFEAQLQSYYQADLKTYLEACSMSEKEWDKQLVEQVESTMKTKMIIYAIAEKEKLTVEGKEYKKEAETLAEQNSASVEELESQYGKDEVKYAIIYQKVQEFIVDNVKEKKGSEPTTEAPTTAKETTKKAK